MINITTTFNAAKQNNKREIVSLGIFVESEWNDFTIRELRFWLKDGEYTISGYCEIYQNVTSPEEILVHMIKK